MKRFGIACVILLTSILSGCLSPVKTPPMYSYTISNWPQKAVVSAKAISRRTILVTTPIASPGYNSSKMVYVMIPYQLKSFAMHRWVVQPAELLLPLMANRIRALHYFRAILTPPFTGVVNYQLNTQLLTLQQEFIQPQSNVRLVMAATLVNVATGQVIASRVFQAIVPAEANNPYEGVLATNKAAHIVLNKIAKFVYTAVCQR